MTKTEIIKRMNRDHMEKLRRFNAMPGKQQRHVPSAYWTEHNCVRYAFEGACLDCGQAIASPALAV